MSVVYNINGTFIGLHTIADKLAYLLAKGIDLAENISSWVVHFMRKVMEALHMKVVKNKNELTRSLIRSVLLTMMEKANKEARNALKHIV